MATMAADSSAAVALRQRMAELTNTSIEDWFLVTKARQGMQVVLGAAGRATGRDEVITQLFTCVTAINPVLAADLTPRYADISANTLRANVDLVKPTERTCAVVLQETFGIMDRDSSLALRKLAHDAGALLLEDSAHCVGRMAKDEQGSPIADVSIHSFGVEKMLFGTYFGGAVWVNPSISDKGVAFAMRDALEALPPMDARLDRATRKYRNQVRMLTRLPRPASQVLRSKWERKGTLEPAVSDEERHGLANHEPSAPSAWVCEQAIAALDSIAGNEERRRACVQAYLVAFGEQARIDLRIPQSVLAASDQPLLRFPVFVRGEQEAQEAIDAIAKLGYYAPPWPRPLLVPGILDASAYGLANGMDDWPVSLSLSAGIVCLPTDIDPAGANDVAQAMQNPQWAL